MPTILPRRATTVRGILLSVFKTLLSPDLQRIGSGHFIINQIRRSSRFIFTFTIPTSPLGGVCLTGGFFFPGLSRCHGCVASITFPVDTRTHTSALVRRLSRVTYGARSVTCLRTCQPFSSLVRASDPQTGTLHSALRSVRLGTLSGDYPLAHLFAIVGPIARDVRSLNSADCRRDSHTLTHIFTLANGASLSSTHTTFVTGSEIELTIRLNGTSSIT